MNPSPSSVPCGWDCHVHVFDPAHPAQAGHYRPVLRDLPEIESAARSLGVGHLVLVQPSVYGTDNRLILRALAREPGRHRGVAVVDTAVTDAELDAMHALGVRGVRFNLVSPVGNGPEAWRALVPRLKARGWHVQWYARHDQLATIAELHEGSGLIAVLDHLAGLHAGIDDDAHAWTALQRLAGQGAWVKLSGWYRLQASAPYGALHAPIRRVAQTLGERLVWGSDWPHTAFAPDDLPPYASVWHPVVQALGEDRAAAVRAAGALLYA
ncbi:MAG TPA: amidohydrolase family protein [Hydrogenophaga sp.]|uniref:amidohydrolase family protein n=1 Tax=Hydrogenophaga sp. TaxID=1904254 RepID=UPI002CAAFA23|nr:amidohydrolase family protein [Hydrogenophaga sp.]HSX93327.1 amidohydrolase family protein [Hydrogenophaga sp.]